MTALVADTGPLNYLLQIQEITFLPRMFREVLIPLSVRAELLHSKAPPAVRDWIANPPSWLKVQEPLQRISGAAELGVGEIDAISLAAEVRGWLLMDDQEGRSFARDKVPRVMGTIGLLELVSAAGLLDLEVALSKLRGTNHRHSVRLIEDALERDRARKGRRNAS